mmetsp:Transcript_14502/g.22509  ORF Transcript_14502/g.22509 Transcript_14502/m.22509 type:complete len:96 (-) Transcript_14502:7-294(-)
MPEEFPQELLPISFFDYDFVPRMWKRSVGEKKLVHYDRIKKDLHLLSSEKFDIITGLVDPDDEDFASLLELISSVKEEKFEMKMGKKGSYFGTRN